VGRAVLARGEPAHVLGVRSQVRRRIAFLVQAQDQRVDRQGQQDERGEEDQRGDHRDRVGLLPRPPDERGPRRAPGGPGEVGPRAHEALDARADRHGIRRQRILAVEERLHGVAELRLLANLHGGAADGVHVDRLGRQQARLEVGPPRARVGLRRVALAQPEGGVERLPAQIGETVQVRVERRVDLAHVHQARRDRPSVPVGGVVEDEQPREVHLLEARERDRRRAGGPGVHGREHAAQLRQPAGLHRGADRHGELVGAAGAAAGRLRAVSSRLHPLLDRSPPGDAAGLFFHGPRGRAYGGAMPKSLPGKTLLGVRFLLGTTSWFTPRFFMAAIGMDPYGNPQAAYMSRLFGVRDLTLGLGLAATKGDARRLWWRLGVLCDVGDAAAGAVSSRRGELPAGGRARFLFTGAGVVGASLGVAALLSRDV
jgi:hypothetical protein